MLAINVHIPVSSAYVGIHREYSTGSFQNKLVCSSFKRVPKYILFLAKLKGEGRAFWHGKA